MPGINQVNYKGTLYDILPDELAQKANIDGVYEGMTVANSEQLISTVFIEDQVPYNFRTAGGSIDIGDREYDTIVGGTVVWNQLFNVNGSIGKNNGTVAVANNTLTFTATNKSTYQYINQGDIVCPANHKLLISVDVTLSQAETVGFGDGTSIYKTVSLNANAKTRITYIRNFETQKNIKKQALMPLPSPTIGYIMTRMKLKV